MFQILNKLTYITNLPFEMTVAEQKVSKKRTTLYFLKKGSQIFTTELSPFPGFSDDTLESLEHKFEKALNGEFIIKNNPHIDFSLYELEMKQKWKKSFTPEIIKTNKLIHYKNNIDFEALKQFETLKVKIDNDTSAVSDFFKEHSSKLSYFKVRLDANARLTLEELEEIYNITLKENINLDYFEEPLKNIKDYKSCVIPFALDENIRFFDTFTNAKALVLKPTQFYSDKIWHKINREDREDKRPIIISSTFDSIFTHATLLAMALTYKEIDHGLDFNNCNDLGFSLKLEDVFPTLDEKHYKEIISKS